MPPDLKSPRILIVEDKMVIAEDLRETLESLGCSVTGIAHSGEMAIKKYLEERPDIVFMDIRLRGRYTGIETAEKLKEMGPVPIIFLTAHSDPATLNAALGTRPANYLVKPFDEKALQIAIGLAMNQERSERDTPYVTFRHQGMVEKVPLDEILYAKAAGSYTIIVTENRQLTLALNLKQFLNKANDLFVRTHRSYVVHKKKVSRYSSKGLYIGVHKIPVSKSYKKGLAGIQ